METLIQELIPIAKSLAGALIVLIVGLFIIKRLGNRLIFVMNKSEIDDDLKPFLSSVLNVGLRILLLVIIVSILGIDISAFMAVLASVGFAIGLAFQGSLSNFAGGVLLLVTRPFSVDDIVETGDVFGKVAGIKILYTEIHTFDNKIVFVPNGNLANTAITNYTRNELRRVDFKFNVGYESDIKKVKSILSKVIDKHELILKEPEPFIRMWEHGESELVFMTRVWTQTENYWPVYYDMMENVKEAFDKEGINIPYPQMDVHMQGKK